MQCLYNVSERVKKELGKSSDSLCVMVKNLRKPRFSFPTSFLPLPTVLLACLFVCFCFVS
ncbi:rCG28525 [Rattus norvegicus]|uniref:RCG28525 n=1 Tax=Rattus norvegicus TaxID=10116 RepID=A6HWI5_RAT|nr:rCG28525 [Rattus norvegicus]